MIPSYSSKAATALLATALVAACAKRPEPIPTPARPVKVELVTSRGCESQASFVGTLRARQHADLGFESPGRIASVLVNVGDHVHAGQALATLEEAPLKWRLDKSQADQRAAAASLKDHETQLGQNESLARDQIISATALESVRAQHELALSQWQGASAALGLAQRDLALSRITAPYDGEVVARLAEPHSDVGAGQPLLQIEGGGTLEVLVMLPDAVAIRLAPGVAATATAAPGGSSAGAVHLKLERLSSHTESGSLVQATFGLDSKARGLRSGEVVSVELPCAGPATLSIPAQALMPAEVHGIGSVFVLDGATSRIRRRAVRYGDALLPGGPIPVSGGLVAGDRVVVAGTAFLFDGQPAVRHIPQTLLHGS